MTDLSAFTEDELDQLLHVPRQVAWAAVLAEDNGVNATAKELYSGGKALMETGQYGSGFLDALAARTPVGETVGGTPDEAIADALGTAPTAIALLRAKGTEQDVHAYGQWLIEIAVTVSNGAEGVSTAEQDFVTRLAEALKS
ncbi:hypothetical protein SAMN05444920_12723 [Nonomuraea solani]|uniref:Uncharacterized protein n=1 Tax=Nonomuraea solani TaxID=1144553 RepID=A0A1H6F033_9ACTN|nr:hypothetical protein [Nonomuraea solani]SEH02485.1 hypothetical protein SAMN05444920_12723 [Nonomuraea solani]